MNKNFKKFTYFVFGTEQNFSIKRKLDTNTIVYVYICNRPSRPDVRVFFSSFTNWIYEISVRVQKAKSCRPAAEMGTLHIRLPAGLT